MRKREELSVFIKMQTRSYLLCRIVNIGTSDNPDLKFTDVSSYGFLTNGCREDGALSPDVKINYASDNMELSYHKDGSPLYKSQSKDYSWHSNYLRPGYRQSAIINCKDLLPLVIFEIRRPEVYRTKQIEQETSRKKVYICDNEILFTETQSLFAVIYIKNKNIPLTRISTKDYHSDIIEELTSVLDLCLYICRHSYPAPVPYYDKSLKGWITPYACNSVSFCNQDALFNELTSKLNNNIFDNTFANFINLLGDGKLLHLTEDKLHVLDEIDIFFNSLKTIPIHKPHFARFVFEIIGDNINTFNTLPPDEKQKILKKVWNVILKEGKQRNWF